MTFTLRRTARRAMWRSGAHKYKGYYTVELGEGISVAAGEEFSVTVRLQNRDGSDVVAAIEMPIAGLDRARAQAGQSFTSTDGRDWTDISAKYSANNCIKVFTDGAGGGTDDSSQGGVGRALSAAQLERTGELSHSGGSVGQCVKQRTEHDQQPAAGGRTADPVTNLPEKFDLRDIGAVTPVKNQGWIPSCWTFATMSSAEYPAAAK